MSTLFQLTSTTALARKLPPRAVALSSAAHDLAARVAHLTRAAAGKHLSETEADPWNWKWIDDVGKTTDLLDGQVWYTTTSWKALLPDDLIIDDGSCQVA